MSLGNIFCYAGRHFATNRSLVQGSPTDCVWACACVCVCVCVCETECDQLQQSLSIRSYVEYLDEAELKNCT